MARPASHKAASTESGNNSFTLPAPIADPAQELMYLLGHLRGRVATADRIAELVLLLQSQWQAKADEAYKEGEQGR